MANTLLVCALLSTLISTVLCLSAPGGWRFAHGATDLGDIELSTNLTANGTAVPVKIGDIYPSHGYEDPVSAIEITISGGNLPAPLTFAHAFGAGYTTILAAGSPTQFFVLSDNIPASIKAVGGSQFAAVRLINSLFVNETVHLKYNGTGYTNYELAAQSFATASAYQTLPSGDSEGLFFVTDDSDNVLAENDVGALKPEYIYTAFLSDDGQDQRLKFFEDFAVTVSYVRAVHAVTGLKAKMDVNVIYNVASNASVATNISYFYVSDYAAIEPGQSTVQLKFYGAASVPPFTQVFNNLVNYTIIVSGSANDTFVEVIVDDLVASNNSALVRFMNLIDGASEVQISIVDASNSSNAVVYNATTPSEDAANYYAVTGASTVKALIYGGKTASPIDYTFEKNTVYTIWAYGPATKPQLFVSQDYPTPPTAKGLSNLELGLIIAGAIMFVILLLAIIIFAVRSRPAEGYERIEN